MQRSVDSHLSVLAKVFAVGAVVSSATTTTTPSAPQLPRKRLWSHICGKVDALSIDEDDIGVMLGKVFGEDDAGNDDDDDGGGGDGGPDLDFTHFVHFLFHLSNAYTLMHEGMLGSDHSLDKLLPVLEGPLLGEP